MCKYYCHIQLIVLYLIQPPLDFKKDPKVDGASVRTRSQVPFGDEAQNNDFYKTTNQEVYVPQNGRPASSDTGSQGHSSIPLDYYPGLYVKLLTMIK